jgi:hypothetical protein
MHRYEEADDSLVEVFLEVLEKTFPKYGNLKFKLIYDLKKRINKGQLVLASIELPSAKVKFFSQDEIAVDGYDYILTVDRKAWEIADVKTKQRVIRHELRHVFIDEKGTPKLVGHEIEDFYAEIDLNKDDPEWRRTLVMITNDVYEQERLMAKEG